MIEKIGQGVNFKLIKESAYKTVDFLKINPKGAEADIAYKQYLSEGKNAPGYAKTIMKLAKNDAFLKYTKQMHDYKISSDEFGAYTHKLQSGFIYLSINNTKAEKELNKAGKEMYPATWDLRCKILNWWSDTSGNKYKTSHLKDLKRDFWSTMAKINPKIMEFKKKNKQ